MPDLLFVSVVLLFAAFLLGAVDGLYFIYAGPPSSRSLNRAEGPCFTRTAPSLCSRRKAANSLLSH